MESSKENIQEEDENSLEDVGVEVRSPDGKDRQSR